jgi:hypothetical protein
MNDLDTMLQAFEQPNYALAHQLALPLAGLAANNLATIYSMGDRFMAVDSGQS